MGYSIEDIFLRGLATSRELQAYTGLSQPAVSRKLRAMGDKIIKVQSGRTPRYALARNAFGGSDRQPLAMVDAYGNTVLAAWIRPLVHGGFFVEAATGTPPVLLGIDQNGLFEGLPYFLQDLAPQGFIGRKIAEEIAKQNIAFPRDPRLWNADHIGRYLISNGDDLPGNFKFGEQTLLRLRRKPEAATEEDYPKLADQVMKGYVPGSSAGGEQPKFTTYCTTRAAHVIVKFTHQDANEVTDRWRDILITEYHATEAIHDKDFPASETRLLEMEGRLFLESQRFDRSGEYGRMSMVSLKSIDDEFVGIGSGWPAVMEALLQKNLVSWQHVYDANCLFLFGQLINNTDMHLENLSLAIEGGVFRLLPVYDMCSMGFAPLPGGNVPPYAFIPVMGTLNGISKETEQVVMAMAKDFWDRVARDERISLGFKRFLQSGNPIDRMQN
ncbi:MAG: type II toxin-antitoxin system HipA family toxin YjjJ [bacterium]|nr:type II toxin-antitoxin system HipA family toxin YjjJ [bacterium]